MLRLRAVFCCLTSILSVCEGYTLIGITGGSITLPCRYDVKANGLTTMCWGRDAVPASKCSKTIVSTDGEKVTVKESRRYRLQSGVEKGDVSLTIVNLTEEDSGIYGCRVQISGWFNDLKLNFHLVVVKDAQTTRARTTLPAETDKLDVPFLVTVQDEATTQTFVSMEDFFFPDITEDETDLPTTETIKTDSSNTTDNLTYTSTDDLPDTGVEKISHKFNGNIIRLGLVIFIPGLIVMVILDLRSLQQKNRRRSAQSDDSAPAVQVRN
ncbi:T-cell immunoglobulin and mucin domain-containing protein 4-like [Conger conger]|uniref:T-cell immunoglobulin and mucin domain-containing protein 4-like n=1 Tax=Conger conger TaxID=82655 RepID=UPI002A5A09BF|nr:T-cell immunoglobulin and mucin domain-containing protein 4-like [Conger conger]